jgi:serine/threonine protein kinase
MTTIGDVYRLGRSLGSGNQGIVRRATRKDGTGTAVAVKLLQLPPDEDRARFRREIALMAENPHENVVPVLESGEEGDGALWYAMPLARSSLAWHLVQGRLDRETIDEVLAQICAGVGHLHAHGIVHRDLKPENVLELEPGHWAVSDLGVAKAVDHDWTTVTETGLSLGTPWYAAPEQWSDAKSATRLADVFSLGRIAQECFAGFESSPDEVDNPAVRAVVRRATSADPADRYGDTDQFLTALRRALNAPEGEWAPTNERLAGRMDQLGPRIDADVVDADLVAEVLVLIEDCISDVDVLVASEDGLPKLGSALLDSIWEQQPQLLRRFFSLYSSQVQAETYNFAFTDEIADFMHRAVQVTGDPSILGSAIAACAVIGQSHNRWHVQEVFRRLVGSVRSSEHALAACEALDQVPDNALAWSVAGFDLDGLHPTIAAAVAKRIGDGSPTAL